MARALKRYENNEKNGRLAGKCWCAGVYCRISVDNSGKSDSIEGQIEYIRRFVERSNLRTAGISRIEIIDIYTDLGVSGTTFDREAFDDMLKAVREKKIDCIIVRDLSRFGRSYIEAGEYIERVLPMLGCRFIAAADNCDSISPDFCERLLEMNLKNLVNEIYARDISKRVAGARKMAALRGSFTGSIPPYGYDVKAENGIRRLVVSPDAAGIVREIYEMYAGAQSVGAIIRALFDNNIHRISDYRRYGHIYCTEGEVLRSWSEGSIYGILKNITYTGCLEQGKTRMHLYEGDRKKLITSSAERYIIHNTHKPIIDKELYEKVKCLYEKNSGIL